MNLIILYGAPAVGKLTVAKAIAEISDYVVFDNHKVIDVIEPVVTRKSTHFKELIYDTHIRILAAAAESDEHDVVTTFPYAANEPEDIRFINNLVEECKNAESEVFLIHLAATNEVLLERVGNESRKTHGKISDKELMKTIAERYDFTTDIPSTFMTVDTGTLSADESARLIIDSIK